ncbi:aldo/keto reductase family domain-containing protein [Ditylenchus destructor]|nr:aldo/keto reductase family domain-containing protein [Ditylenchus destructor]
MAVNVGSISLSNGVKLPLFGLGTWLANDASQLKAALRAALDAGYRYIDTATLYKNEDVIGEILQEYYNAGKFKREDVFITTKLPFYGHSHVDQSLKKSLENLKTDYIDLYLVHTPLPMKVSADLSQPEADADGKFVPELVPIIDTWRQVEKHYKSGAVKSIGVSNFNVKQLQELYNQAEIKPQNLQVECHILFPQTELVALCKKLNISVTSYGTLGSPGSIAIRAGPDGNLFNHPLVVELAKKHNKTPAQILLRQMVQRGISTIPKSTNPGRVKENIDVFDFKISDEDMKRFDEIKERLRLYPFGFARHHPWYPFEQ